MATFTLFQSDNLTFCYDATRELQGSHKVVARAPQAGLKCLAQEELQSIKLNPEDSPLLFSPPATAAH